MSKPSLYQITSREVEPLTELMKAVVEVNWHLYRAREQGWEVDLTVHEETGEVNVGVDRNVWPSPDSEEDEA